MSTTITTPGTNVLKIQEWGWKIELKRNRGGTSIGITTPRNKGYSLSVDEDGNVTEFVSGDYVRVVTGCVIEKTGGTRVDHTEGPHIAKSEAYVAFSGDRIHFNPRELEGPLQDTVPAVLGEA